MRENSVTGEGIRTREKRPVKLSRVKQELSVAPRAILELFREHSDRPFVFIEPGGNFGDLLIYRGAEKLARLAGVEFERIKHDQFMNSVHPEQVVLYVHGSGGFNSWWSGTTITAFQKAINTHRGPVILGPQTFQTDEEFLKQRVTSCFGNESTREIVMFTRERTSYEALRSILPDWVSLQRDHDTALNLARSDLTRKDPNGSYKLHAIRVDKEAVDIRPKDYLAIWTDPVSECRTFKSWLELHERAAEIVTNRLHSAIVGVVLGIPTTILPNNYHKNRSVWEFSLRDRGVGWSDQVPTDRVSSLVDKAGFLGAVLESQTFRRLLWARFGIST